MVAAGLEYLSNRGKGMSIENSLTVAIEQHPCPMNEGAYSRIIEEVDKLIAQRVKEEETSCTDS